MIRAAAYLAAFVNGPCGAGWPGSSSLTRWAPRLFIMAASCLGVGLGLGIVAGFIGDIVTPPGRSGGRTYPSARSSTRPGTSATGLVEASDGP